MNPIAIQALRKRLWENLFRSVEVKTGSKVPAGKDWPERSRQNPPEAVNNWPSADALNTGILCDGLIAVDLDIDDAVIVSQLVAAANHFLGSAPTRTRSDSPRILILYRASEGEPKKRNVEGQFGKIEVLGHGQQFVAFGIHPDGAVYEWDGSLDTFHRDKLTPVTQEALMAFLCAVAPLIGAKPPEATPTPGTALPIAPDPSLVKQGHRDWAAGALKGKIADMRKLNQPNSNRNNILYVETYDMGGYIANGSIDRQTVEIAFFDVMTENAYVHEHSEIETRNTIRSGIDKDMLRPHALRGTDYDVLSNNVLAFKPEKQPPVPLNTDAYIGILGDFIRLEAPISEGDPNAMLITALAIVGSICGRDAYMIVEKDIHHPRLFVTIVGESSKARKGTTTGRAYNFGKMIARKNHGDSFADRSGHFRLQFSSAAGPACGDRPSAPLSLPRGALRGSRMQRSLQRKLLPCGRRAVARISRRPLVPACLPLVAGAGRGSYADFALPLSRHRGCTAGLASHKRGAGILVPPVLVPGYVSADVRWSIIPADFRAPRQARSLLHGGDGSFGNRLLSSGLAAENHCSSRRCRCPQASAPHADTCACCAAREPLAHARSPRSLALHRAESASCPTLSHGACSLWRSGRRSGSLLGPAHRPLAWPHGGCRLVRRLASDGADCSILDCFRDAQHHPRTRGPARPLDIPRYPGQTRMGPCSGNPAMGAHVDNAADVGRGSPRHHRRATTSLEVHGNSGLCGYRFKLAPRRRILP
jgi:hypothetical protein